MNPWIISTAAFFAVSGIVAAIVLLTKDFGKTKTEERLQVFAGMKSAKAGPKGLMKEEVFREGLDGISGMIHRLGARVGSFGNLFEQADSPISGITFLLISAG